MCPPITSVCWSMASRLLDPDIPIVQALPTLSPAGRHGWRGFFRSWTFAPWVIHFTHYPLLPFFDSSTPKTREKLPFFKKGCNIGRSGLDSIKQGLSVDSAWGFRSALQARCRQFKSDRLHFLKLLFSLRLDACSWLGAESGNQPENGWCCRLAEGSVSISAKPPRIPGYCLHRGPAVGPDRPVRVRASGRRCRSRRRGVLSCGQRRHMRRNGYDRGRTSCRTHFPCPACGG